MTAATAVAPPARAQAPPGRASTRDQGDDGTFATALEDVQARTAQTEGQKSNDADAAAPTAEPGADAKPAAEGETGTPGHAAPATPAPATVVALPVVPAPAPGTTPAAEGETPAPVVATPVTAVPAPVASQDATVVALPAPAAQPAGDEAAIAVPAQPAAAAASATPVATAAAAASTAPVATATAAQPAVAATATPQPTVEADDAPAPEPETPVLTAVPGKPGEGAGGRPAGEHPGRQPQTSQPVARPAGAEAARDVRAAEAPRTEAVPAQAAPPMHATPVGPNAAPGLDGTAPGHLRRAAVIEGAQGLLELAARHGMNRARLTLRPQELGGVEVRLHSTAQGVTATVRADIESTASVLQTALGDLRRSLEDAGVTVARLDVTWTGQEGRDGRDGRADADPSRRDANGDAPFDLDALADADVVPITTARAARHDEGALLDVSA